MKKLAAIVVCVALTACGGVGTLRSNGEENVGPYPNLTASGKTGMAVQL